MHISIRILVFLICLLWGSISFGAYTETFYAAHGGDGSDPDCSEVSPFTTAGCASVCFDETDLTNAANWDTDDEVDGDIGYNDVVIFLDDGGTFSAITLNDSSGAEGTPVTFEVYLGDSVVV
jgi:hypothetical protein